MLSEKQLEIDKRNIAFWDELCGTQSAKNLGVTDNSPESLAKFDQWYLDFYPYLCRHVPVDQLAGKRVLEIGLGYGTMATELMSKGADYSGLDIAAGPVEMAQYRAELLGKKADVRQGSILECPFDDESFDYVVSIGCLHHTGDLKRAIESVYRVLKPGGGATIMVYHSRSYRQWCKEPLSTFKKTVFPNPANSASVDAGMRGAYDKNGEGMAAPETDFVSRGQLSRLCRQFSEVSVTPENIGADLVFKRVSRPTALKYFGPWLGLDLYCRLRK
jgi:ubiquinone/menaquinone biosynthesis C-methylase UbiE